MLETQRGTAGSQRAPQRGSDMRQITVTEEKKMTVVERKAVMPYEVLADGEVIGEFGARGKLSTKCPNCGKIFDAQKPTDAPYFFSIKH